MYIHMCISIFIYICIYISRNICIFNIYTHIFVYVQTTRPSGEGIATCWRLVRVVGWRWAILADYPKLYRLSKYPGSRVKFRIVCQHGRLSESWRSVNAVQIRHLQREKERGGVKARNLLETRPSGGAAEAQTARGPWARVPEGPFRTPPASSSQFQNSFFAEMWSGSEQGSYLRILRPLGFVRAVAISVGPLSTSRFGVFLILTRLQRS